MNVPGKARLRRETMSFASRLALAALAVAALMAGCRPSEQAAQNVPSGSSSIAKGALVELTYPQSDPNGYYVALSQPGTYAIEGTVASQEPVRKVSVNGVEVVPYRVENYPSYNTPANADVYRFRAPLILQPGTRIVVRVTDPPVAREYVYSPDTNATVSYWQQAANATPGDAGLLYRLGNALLGQNASAAIDSLTTALQTNQEAPWTSYQLGKAYLAAGRPAEALNPLNSAITAYPAFPDAYYDRGVAYYDLQRYDQAAVDLTNASKIVPNWAEPLVALGLTYYAEKRLQDAANVYVQASTMWPTWPVPNYSLAMVRLDEGRMNEANFYLDRAEKLGPWRAIHHQQLAEKLFAKGNNVAAWRQVQIAQKLGGGPSQDFLNRLGRKMPEPRGKPMWWTGKAKAGTEPPGLAKKGGQVHEKYSKQESKKARGKQSYKKSPKQGKHASRQQKSRGKPSAVKQGKSGSGGDKGKGGKSGQGKGH